MSERDEIIPLAEGKVEVKKRPPLKITFNEAFPLPADVNLDPSNEEYIESLPATLIDEGITVDVIEFEVNGTHISGNIEVIHLYSALEECGISVRRPSLMTGPYAFDMNIFGITWHDRQNGVLVGKVEYKNDSSLTILESYDMNEKTGLWEAFSDSWMDATTREASVALFSPTDIPEVRFTLQYPDNTSHNLLKI